MEVAAVVSIAFVYKIIELICVNKKYSDINSFWFAFMSMLVFIGTLSLSYFILMRDWEELEMTQGLIYVGLVVVLCIACGIKCMIAAGEHNY